MNLEAAAVATYRASMLGDETTVTPSDYMEPDPRPGGGGPGYGRH